MGPPWPDRKLVSRRGGLFVAVFGPNECSCHNLAAATRYVLRYHSEALRALEKEDLEEVAPGPGSCAQGLCSIAEEEEDQPTLSDQFMRLLVEGKRGARIALEGYLPGGAASCKNLSGAAPIHVAAALKEMELDVPTEPDMALRHAMLVDVAAFYFGPRGPESRGLRLSDTVSELHLDWAIFSTGMQWYYTTGPGINNRYGDTWGSHDSEMASYLKRRKLGDIQLGNTRFKLGLVHSFYCTGELPSWIHTWYEEAFAKPTSIDASAGSSSLADAAIDSGPPILQDLGDQYRTSGMSQHEIKAAGLGFLQAYRQGPEPSSCRGPLGLCRYLVKSKKAGVKDVHGMPRLGKLGTPSEHYASPLECPENGNVNQVEVHWYSDPSLVTQQTLVDLHAWQIEVKEFKRQRRVDHKLKCEYPFDPDNPVINPQVNGRPLRPPELHSLEKVATDFRLVIEMLRSILPEQYVDGDRNYKALRARELMHFVSRAETCAEVVVLILHWRGRSVSAASMGRKQQGLVQAATGAAATGAAAQAAMKTAQWAKCNKQEIKWREEGKFTRGMQPDPNQISFFDPSNKHNTQAAPKGKRGKDGQMKEPAAGEPPVAISIDDLSNPKKQFFNVFDDPRLEGDGKSTHQDLLHHTFVRFSRAAVALRRKIGIVLADKSSDDHVVRKNELPRGSTGMAASQVDPNPNPNPDPNPDPNPNPDPDLTLTLTLTRSNETRWSQPSPSRGRVFHSSWGLATQLQTPCPSATRYLRSLRAGSISTRSSRRSPRVYRRGARMPRYATPTRPTQRDLSQRRCDGWRDSRITTSSARLIRRSAHRRLYRHRLSAPTWTRTNLVQYCSSRGRACRHRTTGTPP